MEMRGERDECFCRREGGHWLGIYNVSVLQVLSTARKRRKYVLHCHDCGPELDHRKVSMSSWRTWGCRQDQQRGQRSSHCPSPFVEVERINLETVDGVVDARSSCEYTSQFSVSRSRPQTTYVLGPYSLSLAPECITLLGIQLDIGLLFRSGLWCSSPRRLWA